MFPYCSNDAESIKLIWTKFVPKPKGCLRLLHNTVCTGKFFCFLFFAVVWQTQLVVCVLAVLVKPVQCHSTRRVGPQTSQSLCWSGGDVESYPNTCTNPHVHTHRQPVTEDKKPCRTSCQRDEFLTMESFWVKCNFYKRTSEITTQEIVHNWYLCITNIKAVEIPDKGTTLLPVKSRQWYSTKQMSGLISF